MKKIKVGIIGIGNMGTQHAQHIVEGTVGNMELVAIADRKPERVAWAKENLKSDNITYYSEGSKLIDAAGVDAIIVAVPHYQHTNLAIQGFNKGLNVLVEKPAGVDTKDVHLMNEVSVKSGKAFSMMFNQRTNSVYKKMYEIVHGKKFGDVMRVNWIITDWFRTQHYYDSGDWRGTWDGEGGGVLLNQCPHQLDLLQWICGMPESVRAFCLEGNWHDIEVEDDVTAYLKYPNGATGVFVTSTADAPGTNRFEVTMEKAKLICENDELTIVEIGDSALNILKTSNESFVEFQPKTYKIETDGENPQHVGILRNFADHIINGTPLIAQGTEGINGLTLSNMMHLSSWTEKTIEKPINEDLFLYELNNRRATSRYKEKVANMKNQKQAVEDLKGTY